MTVNADDLVECPHCRDGIIVNPFPGGSDLCLHCSGLGFTLRYIRCLCGRQVNLTKELQSQMYFCGREKCAKAWKANLPVETEAQCCLNM